MAENVRRRLFIGKKHTFLQTFLTSAGAAQDLTGASIWLTAKLSEADTDASAIFDLSTTDGNIVPRAPLTLGLADVTIAGINTEGLTEWTLLKYDIQIKPAAATDAYVVETGTFECRMPVKRGDT